MKKSFTLILLAVFALVSCKGVYEDGAEMAIDLKSKVKQISADTLHKRVDNGESLFIIDIRSEDEYLTETIPGAYSIPKGILEFSIGSEEFWAEQFNYPPEKDTEIIIISSNGDMGVLSAVALTKLGYKNIINLDGGFKAYNPNQDPNAAPKTGGGCGGQM